MNLEEAYRLLEVEPGADEDTVREARKTLAKVWHPDRHANDAELMKRAQDKLASVNAAFEVVENAGFPAKPAAKAAPKPAAPTPPPRAPDPPPRVEPKIEFVPNRRVRWWVILVLAGALGLGAYVAITRLGASTTTTPPPRDAMVVVATPDAPVVETTVDADVVVVADAPDEVDAAGAIVRREKTFTLGSTKDEVIAAQGQPQGTSTRRSSINGVQTASTTLSWGESSSVDLDGNEKVIGWSEGDSPLHVRIEIRDAAVAAAAKARGTFAIGASTDEVLGILGPPTAINGKRWSYGTSTLDIERGKLARITQGEPKLPVR